MKTRHLIAAVAFAVVVFGFAACVPAGRIVTEEKRGDLTRRVTVQQPGKAVQPATLEQSGVDEGLPPLRASTGARQTVDHAAVRRSGLVTWSGVALCVIGAALVVLRGWLPVIPMSASIATIGVGVALLWLPAVMQQYTWLLLIVAGFVAVMHLTGGIDNWIKLRSPAPGAAKPE